MANIAVYGSHNASIVVEDKGEILLVVEVERFFNYKNSGLTQYKTVKADFIFEFTKHLIEYVKSYTGFDSFDKCYFMNTDVIIDEVRYNIIDYIPAKEFIPCLHHRSHAANTFYQSDFEEALVFSFDGGGNDGFFNIYHATRKDSVNILQVVLNPTQNNPHIYHDLGFPYMIFGQYLEDINWEALSDGNLVYAGKIMGLVSYGKVREEWLDHFKDFYKQEVNGLTYTQHLADLQTKTGINFDISNRISGQDAYDIATTSQRAFEDVFIEIAKPYFEKYPNLPICIAGGCGLNILLNTRLVEEFKKVVHVGPNPNDCGLAVGMIADHLRPQTPIDITYKGLPLLDLDTLGSHIQNFPYNLRMKQTSHSELVTALKSGKIIGVARGRAEHGPRALGNRSIICNPTLPDMKDVLNHKVKHREWYRPFAPVVRLEDVSEYFEWEGDCRWMSFSPKVRKEWREKLPSITHIDNTARVQTVTREQNEWLYDLITEFKKETGVGVLLNTSFNVAGKPILSTISDAFSLFQTSEMDCLLIENTYLEK